MSELAEFAGNMNAIYHLITNPIIIWNWFIGLAYWIATFVSIICIIFHATTGDRKPIRIMVYVIVSYVLLLGVDTAL